MRRARRRRQMTQLAARIAAALSLGLWLMVVALGRLIAYF